MKRPRIQSDTKPIETDDGKTVEKEVVNVCGVEVVLHENPSELDDFTLEYQKNTIQDVLDIASGHLKRRRNRPDNFLLWMSFGLLAYATAFWYNDLLGAVVGGIWFIGLALNSLYEVHISRVEWDAYDTLMTYNMELIREHKRRDEDMDFEELPEFLDTSPSTER